MSFFFVFVKMVWISDVLPHYGLAKYHLAELRMRQNISKMDYWLLIIICPFMFLQSWITQKANLFDLKRCQFNVSFVSLLSPFVLFFGPVCGQVLHTNQRCPSSCCPYTRNCAWNVKSLWHCYMKALSFCMSPVFSLQIAILFRGNNNIWLIICVILQRGRGSHSCTTSLNNNLCYDNTFSLPAH